MRRTLILLLLSCLHCSAWAVEVEGLFRVSVPVTGQGAEERRGALHAAFSRLLIRVSSGRSVLADSRALALLERAPRFVAQYRYRETGDGLRLEVSFDQRAVERALLEQGLPLWGRTRPLTLVWLVVQEGGERRLLNGDASHPVVGAMRNASRERALPLAFPLLDLEDQTAITVTDVWAGFMDRIRRASERYAPDAVLVGRLYRDLTTHRWQVRWLLLDGGRVIDRWEDAGPLDWVGSEGVEHAADDLALRYAQRPGRAQVVWVQIEGVAGLADYARVRRYLADLSVVERAQPSEVVGGQLVLELRLRGDVGALVRAIALGGTLLPVQFGEAASEALQYRLLPP